MSITRHFATAAWLPAASRPCVFAAIALMLAACGTTPASESARMPEVSALARKLPPPMAGEIAMRAMTLVGRPYKWGGAGFDEGFDCSGFVQVVYRDGVGVQLPRVTAQQAQATLPIDRRQLAPGDLVFFNTLQRPFSHVGIYVGDGRFVHSPKAGASVRIESMLKPYWQLRFDGARRVQVQVVPAHK